MVKKVIMEFFDTCRDCPEFHSSFCEKCGCDTWWCDLEDREIEYSDDDAIPAWCPLEDMEEEQ